MAALKIETLLAKFGCKGQSYGNLTGAGTPMFTVEEQLAIVGICWNKSPAGWLCLMVECLSDQSSHRELLAMMLHEAKREMTSWRGPFPQKALSALAITAIAESIQLGGQLCGECAGTAKALTKAQQWRKCPACDNGRVPWSNESRYAKLVQVLTVPYSRFTRYKPLLERLVNWLSMERTAALFIIQEQIEKERQEAELGV